MSASNGFVKVPRRVLDALLFRRTHGPIKVFMYFKQKADWRESTGRSGLRLLPGQVEFTVAEISSACRLTNQQTKDALKTIQECGGGTIKTTNQGSVITLVDSVECELQELAKEHTKKQAHSGQNNKPTNEQKNKPLHKEEDLEERRTAAKPQLSESSGGSGQAETPNAAGDPDAAELRDTLHALMGPGWRLGPPDAALVRQVRRAASETPHGDLVGWLRGWPAGRSRPPRSYGFWPGAVEAAYEAGSLRAPTLRDSPVTAGVETAIPPDDAAVDAPLDTPVESRIERVLLMPPHSQQRVDRNDKRNGGGHEHCCPRCQGTGKHLPAGFKEPSHWWDKGQDTHKLFRAAEIDCVCRQPEGVRNAS